MKRINQRFREVKFCLLMLCLIMPISSVWGQMEEYDQQQLSKNILYFTVNEYLAEGYAVNTHRLEETTQLLKQLETCAINIRIIDTLQGDFGPYEFYSYATTLPAIDCGDLGGLIGLNFYDKRMDWGIFGKYKNKDRKLLFVSGFLYKNDIRYLLFYNKKATREEIKRYIALCYYNYKPSHLHINTSKQTASFYSSVTQKRHQAFFKSNQKEQLIECP